MMNKIELANKIEEVLTQHAMYDVLLSNCDGSSLPNVVFDVDGNPCIPVMEGTDDGPRKRFTIKITDDTEG